MPAYILPTLHAKPPPPLSPEPIKPDWICVTVEKKFLSDDDYKSFESHIYLSNGVSPIIIFLFSPSASCPLLLSSSYPSVYPPDCAPTVCCCLVPLSLSSGAHHVTKSLSFVVVVHSLTFFAVMTDTIARNIRFHLFFLFQVFSLFF